ncbi:MAG: tRNA (guanosine(46)-N7)-methyltransferase TrmB [Ruminococcus sp.]|jgi:tRNA (guanine-N7-)-methyltransferase
MRLRNIPGSREVIAQSRYVIQDPRNQKGHWRELFLNSAPIQIEVGMGKGRFIMDMAERHPHINYVGIEMYDSVLLRAIQKREQFREELTNLYFLRVDARELPEIFEKEEVDKIYLNFSDPWPKDRHAKRRLTSRQFLEKYDCILKKDGTVEFKTDNRGLFEFSLREAEDCGWRILSHTFDLHSDQEMCRENVMTEYEEKFSSMGNPICKMIIRR